MHLVSHHFWRSFFSLFPQTFPRQTTHSILCLARLPLNIVIINPKTFLSLLIISNLNLKLYESNGLGNSFLDNCLADRHHADETGICTTKLEHLLASQPSFINPTCELMALPR